MPSLMPSRNRFGATVGPFFFIVQQQTVAVVQRFGKFNRLADAGLHVKAPFIEKVAGTVNLRVQQLDVEVETKTRDNVFVRVIVSVQYFVLADKVYDAFYKLDDPVNQIKAFVFDVVRARVPRIKLDDVFEKKDEIAGAVKTELSQVMDDFGYGIVKTLVTDIDPDAKVKEAMNEINAAADARRGQRKGRGREDHAGEGGRGRRGGEGPLGQGGGRPAAGDRRGAPRVGGRVPEDGARHVPAGRDEPDPDDPVLRHAQGRRPVVEGQHHPAAPRTGPRRGRRRAVARSDNHGEPGGAGPVGAGRRAGGTAPADAPETRR